MANLAELNKTLATQSYVAPNTWVPTAADFATFDQIGTQDLSKFENVGRWFRHIATFDAAERAALSSGSSPSPSSSSSSAAPAASSSAAAPAKKAADDDDDDVDLFAEDGEEDEEAAAELAASLAERRKKKEAEEAAKEAAKPKIIERSVVILDIKPWDSEQDLAALENKIRTEVSMEGLEWKAAQVKPIGYGVMKLVMSCHIIDSMVSVDDIQEAIQAFEDDVQSTDVDTFTKL